MYADRHSRHQGIGGSSNRLGTATARPRSTLPDCRGMRSQPASGSGVIDADLLEFLTALRPSSWSILVAETIGDSYLNGTVVATFVASGIGPGGASRAGADRRHRGRLGRGRWRGLRRSPRSRAPSVGRLRRLWVPGFPVSDAGAKTAMVAGELYLRGEDWKFRPTTSPDGLELATSWTCWNRRVIVVRFSQVSRLRGGCGAGQGVVV